VQPKSWHVATTKLHELQMQPTINQVNVVPDVMVVHNEEGVFNQGGHWHDNVDPTWYCWIPRFNH